MANGAHTQLNPFSITLRGNFHVPCIPPETVTVLVERLADAVRHQFPRSLTIKGNTIIFTAGLFRGIGGSNKLASLSSGEISVKLIRENAIVYYQIRFWGLLAGTIIVSCLAAPVIFSGGASTLAITVLAVFFTLTYLLNFVRVRNDFPRFLKSAARTIEF